MIQNKQNPTKKTGLGRGLGSLLGEASTMDQANPILSDENKVVPQVTAKQPDVKSLLKSEVKPEAKPTAAPAAQSPVSTEQTQAVAAVPEHARIWQLPIEKVVQNPGQPRQHFDKSKLDELSASIKQKGVLQPILVKKVGENFEIVAGERRWRATQLAGLKEIPAIIKTFEDQDSYEVALMENIQRHDLNAVEEAEAYQHLMKTYNMTQQQVAEKVGKDRATVANVLRLLQLPESVRQLVIKDQLSLGHAKVLMTLPTPEEQTHLAEKAVREKLSVRHLEQLVALQFAKAKAKTQPSASSDDLLRAKMAKSAVDALQKKLGSKIQLDYDKGEGSLKLHFFSDQEFNALIECLQNIRKNNG